MLRLSERNANIFADCNASDSNIDFVKGVPSGQAFTSEGVLFSVLRSLYSVLCTLLEVQKYKRERAMGDSNTTLAVAMERHMNLMWHNISKAVALETIFQLQQP